MMSYDSVGCFADVLPRLCVQAEDVEQRNDLEESLAVHEAKTYFVSKNNKFT